MHAFLVLGCVRAKVCMCVDWPDWMSRILLVSTSLELTLLVYTTMLGFFFIGVPVAELESSWWHGKPFTCPATSLPILLSDSFQTPWWCTWNVSLPVGCSCVAFQVSVQNQWIGMVSHT